jgi:hypothetical protein
MASRPYPSMLRKFPHIRSKYHRRTHSHDNVLISLVRPLWHCNVLISLVCPLDTAASQKTVAIVPEEVEQRSSVHGVRSVMAPASRPLAAPASAPAASPSSAQDRAHVQLVSAVLEVASVLRQARSARGVERLFEAHATAPARDGLRRVNSNGFLAVAFASNITPHLVKGIVRRVGRGAGGGGGCQSSLGARAVADRACAHFALCSKFFAVSSLA